jgi:predicted small integral membrane protein
MADSRTDSVKLEAPVQHKGRKGFLPMQTNRFDRVFISVILFIAISLLWMRFVEPLGVPLWISTVISILLGIWIVRKG